MNFILTEQEKKITTSFSLWDIQKIFLNDRMVVLAMDNQVQPDLPTVPNDSYRF